MMTPTVSIVIPTYGREQVLLETIQFLLDQSAPIVEILVIDQTPEHVVSTGNQLRDWHNDGRINWVRRDTPGIPQAMNAGLQLSSGDLVLFLDDDIIPDERLVAAHVHAHVENDVIAVVGRVLQPGQNVAECIPPRRLKGLRTDFDFPFHSSMSGPVTNVMAGNLSVRRCSALNAGGFDEQYQGSAYRFETDFARRVIARGGRIWYSSDAGIRHLRVPSGGTRQAGDHRASAEPRHGVGDYYYAMQHGRMLEAHAYMVYRLFREVATKYHLRRPWSIPVKLVGEVRAWWWARQLHREGPRLLSADEPLVANEVEAS